MPGVVYVYIFRDSMPTNISDTEPTYLSNLHVIGNIFYDNGL